MLLSQDSHKTALLAAPPSKAVTLHWANTKAKLLDWKEVDDKDTKGNDVSFDVSLLAFVKIYIYHIKEYFDDITQPLNIFSVIQIKWRLCG